MNVTLIYDLDESCASGILDKTSPGFEDLVYSIHEDLEVEDIEVTTEARYLGGLLSRHTSDEIIKLALKQLHEDEESAVDSITLLREVLSANGRHIPDLDTIVQQLSS